MFNTKPISFYVSVSINRSDEYMEVVCDERISLNALFARIEAHHNVNLGSESDKSDDDTMNKKRIINDEQTFKEDECVICLTDPPNVLFCNCGHLCLCAEYSKIECFDTCPICKTENTILRIIE